MHDSDHLAADDWSARLDAIRPALGLDPAEKQWLRDQAERSIARVAQAERAARLLETITADPAGPKVNAPRHLASELRRLADELDADHVLGHGDHDVATISHGVPAREVAA